MEIEPYWESSNMYDVVFLVKLKKTEKKIYKTLIFPELMDDDQIANSIRTKFNCVIDVISIEKVESCLLLKS